MPKTPTGAKRIYEAMAFDIPSQHKSEMTELRQIKGLPPESARGRSRDDANRSVDTWVSAGLCGSVLY